MVVHRRARTVTHLVVSDRQLQGRLVPLDLVDVDAATGKVRLRCATAEFGRLDDAEMTVAAHGNDADPENSYGQFPGPTGRFLADALSVSYDILPAGEVAVRGGKHVLATDGTVGQIQGLVIDSGSRQLTHVLLQEGHVFGRKVVAIPIGAVTDIGQNGIQLSLTRQQVKELPSGWHRSSG